MGVFVIVGEQEREVMGARRRWATQPTAKRYLKKYLSQIITFYDLS